jgi:hypothetical protein
LSSDQRRAIRDIAIRDIATLRIARISLVLRSAARDPV